MLNISPKLIQKSIPVLRTSSHGCVFARINTLTKDFSKCGYETSSRRQQTYNLASIVSDIENLSIK